MTIPPQVIIIALASALLGLIVGYWLPQRRLRQLSLRLQQHQQAMTAMESAHTLRLQETVQHLVQDHQVHLTEQAAHYQDELVSRLQDLSQEHDTHLQIVQQATPAPAAAEAEADQNQQLKERYEARLKEAAQKLQRAYEQQLAQRSRAAQSEAQTAYEARLAEKIEHYETQLAHQLAQLEAEFTARQAATPAPQPNPAATPSAIIGTGNDDPTVTLYPHQARPPIAATSPEPAPPRVEEITQRLQADYETKLAEKLAQYQDQWSARLTELEAEYQSRLATLQQTTAPTPPPPSIADQLDSLDLEDISQLS